MRTLAVQPIGDLDFGRRKGGGGLEGTFGWPLRGWPLRGWPLRGVVICAETSTVCASFKATGYADAPVGGLGPGSKIGI